MVTHNQRTKIDQNFRSTFLAPLHPSCRQLKPCCPSIVFTPKPREACGAKKTKKQNMRRKETTATNCNSVGEDIPFNRNLPQLLRLMKQAVNYDCQLEYRLALITRRLYPLHDTSIISNNNAVGFRLSEE